MDLDFWRKKRVLVTGGSGFVGRWVGRALAPAEAELHVLDLAPPKQFEVAHQYHKADMRDLAAVGALLDGVKPALIVHLAGQPGVQSSHDNPVGAYEANVLCTFNLLEACRTRPGVEGIVAVSSNHVYGHQHHMPTKEHEALNGEGTYAVTKLCGDVLSRTYGKTYGLPVGIARMTNSFGGDDHHVSHIITATILSCLRGEAPVIKQSGKDRKGYLYVKDTAEGLLAVAAGVAKKQSLRGEAFNLVPNEAWTVLELVKTIMQIAGMKGSPAVHKPEAEHEDEYLDNAKAREQLGWVPKYDFQRAIAETLEWYKTSGQAHR
ncbi:MAG TPA: NAD-dependent epimerase/dehydratase family protein [Pirellulales bacterium]|nr:NAD-dependent epimerase/dehydratase family protein [Pirellulales bacterium]